MIARVVLFPVSVQRKIQRQDIDPWFAQDSELTPLRLLTHEKGTLGQWMQTVPPPPALDPGAAEPKELLAARRAAETAEAGPSGGDDG